MTYHELMSADEAKQISEKNHHKAEMWDECVYAINMAAFEGYRKTTIVYDNLPIWIKEKLQKLGYKVYNGFNNTTVISW